MPAAPAGQDDGAAEHADDAPSAASAPLHRRR